MPKNSLARIQVVVIISVITLFQRYNCVGLLTLTSQQADDADLLTSYY